MMGCPNEGASESRTVRGTTVLHAVAEVRPDFLHDLIGELGPGVVHDKDDRGHLERGVEAFADELDVTQQLAQTLECVVLALDRDDHFAGGREPVHRQQTKGGRTIDQHEVVVGEHRLDRASKLELATNAGTSSISAPARSRLAGATNR